MPDRVGYPQVRFADRSVQPRAMLSITVIGNWRFEEIPQTVMANPINYLATTIVLSNTKKWPKLAIQPLRCLLDGIDMGQ